MKSTPEAQDAPIVIPARQPEAPKPDTYTQVGPGLYRNNRTGQTETRLRRDPRTDRWVP